MAGTQALEIQTHARGDVPAGAMDLAVRRVRSLLRLAPRPVLSARVTLTMAADPAMERPAIAQANLDLNGRVIRVRAVGETMRIAIERMRDRLRVRLERAARTWLTARRDHRLPRRQQALARRPRSRKARAAALLSAGLSR